MVSKEGRKMNTNDLWEQMGDVEEDDIPHVLTKLFGFYEERLSHDPQDKSAELFFEYLSRSLKQVDDCNLNRR